MLFILIYWSQYIYIYMYDSRMYVCVCVCVGTYVHICMCIFIYVYIRVCIYEWLCTYICDVGAGSVEKHSFLTLAPIEESGQPHDQRMYGSHSIGGLMCANRSYGLFDEKSLEPDWIRNPNCTVRSLLTMLTAIALAPMQHSTRRLSSPAN